MRPIAGWEFGADGSAQHSGARTRISRDFGLTGADRLAGQCKSGRRRQSGLRHVARSGGGRAARIAQELLDDAIFQAVKADHRQSAAAAQQALGREQ